MGVVTLVEEGRSDVLDTLVQRVQVALSLKVRVRNSCLMALAEAAKEGQVVRCSKYFFDLVEVKSAFRNIILLVNRIFY